MKTLFGKASIKWGKRDAALVFREDGTCELYIPNGDDEEAVGPNVMLASALGVAVKENPDLVAILIESFTAKVRGDING
jgi:hypothetical protein